MLFDLGLSDSPNSASNILLAIFRARVQGVIEEMYLKIFKTLFKETDMNTTKTLTEYIINKRPTPKQRREILKQLDKDIARFSTTRRLVVCIQESKS